VVSSRAISGEQSAFYVPEIVLYNITMHSEGIVLAREPSGRYGLLTPGEEREEETTISVLKD